MIIIERQTYVDRLIQLNKIDVPSIISDKINYDKEAVSNNTFVHNINKFNMSAYLPNTTHTALGSAQMAVPNELNAPAINVMSNLTANIASTEVNLDVTFYLVPEANGLQNIAIKAISGQRMSVRLTEESAESYVVIKDLIGLPASLYFNKENSAIEGIPFIIGDFGLTCILQNGKEIRIILKIIPKDLF